MLHFGRRGRGNLATLTRLDFAVQQNEEGILFVYKTKDEKTKNHQNDNGKSSDGRMYQMKGKTCTSLCKAKTISKISKNNTNIYIKPKLKKEVKHRHTRQKGQKIDPKKPPIKYDP